MNDKLQRTDDWFAKRLGKFTASNIGEILKKGRGKDEPFSKTAISYIRKKIAEQLTGQKEEIHGPALEWGTNYEETAIMEYEELTDVQVKEVGFIPLKSYEQWAGGSPDGVVSKDKIIEVKCPFSSAIHTETLITRKIPESWDDKYYAQIQFNMLVTGAKECDFISFDPRMKNPNHRLVVITIERDDAYLANLIERLDLAIKYVKECYGGINQ